MTRISQPVSPEPEIDEEAAITRRTAAPRWTSVLIWLLRLSAVICLLRGLTYWAELLGLFQTDFAERPLLQQGAIVFFAAVYCFATVGLWLAAAWGAAVWIIALIGETLFLLLEPGMAAAQGDLALNDPLRAPGHLMLGVTMILAYAVVGWLASREQK